MGRNKTRNTATWNTTGNNLLNNNYKAYKVKPKLKDCKKLFLQIRMLTSYLKRQNIKKMHGFAFISGQRYKILMRDKRLVL